MCTRILSRALFIPVIMLGVLRGWAFLPPAQTRLPNIDLRGAAGVDAAAVTVEQRAAAAELRSRLPNVRVDFDEVTGAPSDGFGRGRLAHRR